MGGSCHARSETLAGEAESAVAGKASVAMVMGKGAQLADVVATEMEVAVVVAEGEVRHEVRSQEMGHTGSCKTRLGWRPQAHRTDRSLSRQDRAGTLHRWCCSRAACRRMESEV